MAIWVLERALYFDRARDWVDLRADRREAADESLVWIHVAVQRDLQAGCDARDRLLGEGEVDEYLAVRLKGDDRCPLGYILAEVDLTNADTATERRADGLAVDDRFHVFHISVGFFHVGDRTIQLRLWHIAAFAQGGRTLEFDFR